MTKKSTNELSKLIVDTRMRNYTTAKEFWNQNQKELGISYSHYVAIETGNRFPDINSVLSISNILKINLRTVCHLWAKVQMPSAETKSYFEPIPGSSFVGFPQNIQPSLDEYYVFTERQITPLETYPEIWDSLMYLMGFSSVRRIPPQEIAKALKQEVHVIEKALDWLKNENLVAESEGLYRTRRKYFHIPNTEPFTRLRSKNFNRISNQIAQNLTFDRLSNGTASRSTFIRRMTAQQAKEVCKHIDSLNGHIGNLDDHGNELYALSVGLGPIAKSNQ